MLCANSRATPLHQGNGFQCIGTYIVHTLQQNTQQRRCTSMGQQCMYSAGLSPLVGACKLRTGLTKRSICTFCWLRQHAATATDSHELSWPICGTDALQRHWMQSLMHDVRSNERIQKHNSPLGPVIDQAHNISQGLLSLLASVPQKQRLPLPPYGICRHCWQPDMPQEPTTQCSNWTSASRLGLRTT